MKNNTLLVMHKIFHMILSCIEQQTLKLVADWLHLTNHINARNESSAHVLNNVSLNFYFEIWCMNLFSPHDS